MAKVNRHGKVSNNPARRWVGGEKMHYCGPHNLHYRSKDFAMCPQCAHDNVFNPRRPDFRRTVYEGVTVAVWDDDDDDEPEPEDPAMSQNLPMPDARTWAREHGYEVKDKGPLPKAVKDAYEAALADYYQSVEKSVSDDLSGRNTDAGGSDGV